MAQEPEGFDEAPAEPQTPAPERPVEGEDMGPVPELLKAATVEAAAEATGEEEFFEAERALGVQHEGIGAAQVLGFVLAILAVIGMAIAFIFVILSEQVRGVEDAFANEVNYVELREAEAEADRLLEQYSVLDEDEGIYRIPIDRAMELMANEAYTTASTRTYSPELQLLPGN